MFAKCVCRFLAAYDPQNKVNFNLSTQIVLQNWFWRTENKNPRPKIRNQLDEKHRLRGIGNRGFTAVKHELTTTSEYIATTILNFYLLNDLEQRPPVYNGHYFGVPRAVIVHRFDCVHGLPQTSTDSHKGQQSPLPPHLIPHSQS